GHPRHCARGDDVPALVWVEAEHQLSVQGWRALFDDADAEVAVLDRAGEVSVLERRAHQRVLLGGDLAAEDQGLGAAADSAAHGADLYVVGARRGQGFCADLAASGLGDPERPRLLRHRLFSPAVREPHRPFTRRPTVKPELVRTNGGAVWVVRPGPLVVVLG